MHVSGRIVLMIGTVLALESCTVKINDLRSLSLAAEVVDPCLGLDALVPFARGDGSVGDPYGICSKEQMNRVGSNATYLDKYFILLADIDLSSYTGNSFTLIGTSADPFIGTFDGNGKVISNFTYSSPGVSNIALFRKLELGGVVKNLGIESATISGGMYTGILAGEASGTVDGCHTQGTVTGSTRVGGMIGRYWGPASYGSITNSYSTGSVSGTEYIGGLIGMGVLVNITNTYSTGTVAATTNRTGGLLGVLDKGDVTNCYTDTVVTAGGLGAGGLIGAIGGRIINSYSKGSVSGTDYIGGLAGWVEPNNWTGVGLIKNSYSQNSVTGRDLVGGLTGYTYAPAPITDSYSRSTVSARQWVGGLVGWAVGTITNSYYASTSLTASIGDLGGLTGGSNTNVTNSFWDVSTTGVVVSGHNNISDGVGGETTATMQTATTYTGAGWSSAIWDIVDGSYPTLK